MPTPIENLRDQIHSIRGRVPQPEELSSMLACARDVEITIRELTDVLETYSQRVLIVGEAPKLPDEVIAVLRRAGVLP